MTSIPMLSISVVPNSPADSQRLDAGLQQLTAEDPMLRAQTDPQTSQVVIGGMGELHLEIVVDRLRGEFGVEAAVSQPTVVQVWVDVDGTMAFRLSGSIAFHDWARKHSVMFEPVMRLEVNVPREYLGDVKGNLASRRGQIEALDDRGATQVVRARVPMSQMFGYAADLRERTLGRATFTLKFDRYEPVGGGFDATDDRHSSVGWPVMPKKPLNNSAIALPEPD